MSKLRLFLVIASGAICLYFLGKVSIQLWDYLQLKKYTEVVITNWEIEDISSSKYFIAAAYQYEVNSRQYIGKTVFFTPKYLNRFSAETDLQKWCNYRWQAWYNPSDPGYSSLQRIFPYKNCIYAIICSGLFIYFCFLLLKSPTSFFQQGSKNGLISSFYTLPQRK
jgi:hypothetical protein